jgi:hypothetical protein
MYLSSNADGANLLFGGNVTVGGLLSVSSNGQTAANFEFNYFSINAKAFYFQTIGNIAITTSNFNVLNLTLQAASVYLSNINVVGNLTVLRNSLSNPQIDNTFSLKRASLLRTALLSMYGKD